MHTVDGLAFRSWTSRRPNSAVYVLVHGIGIPLLVLRGAADPIARERWVRRLAARAPVGSVSSIPGHRHLVQYTAAAAAAARIRAHAPGAAGTL